MLFFVSLYIGLGKSPFFLGGFFIDTLKTLSGETCITCDDFRIGNSIK
jgi:hypothetical protein